ncbi:MAG: dTMP kinase [Acidimicrobiia bacterium]
MIGRFIVLEGGEGAGKGTQVPRLAARIAASGREVVTTFEPGGTALGARIRELTHHFDGPLDARAEALLMAADRAQHLAELVRPALERGAVVISDRFVPSSIVYQGIGRELGADAIAEINAWATNGLVPDCVVVLDVDAAVAATRVPTATDRLEAAGDEFHARVRASYRELAGAQGWAIVEGGGTPDGVADAVWAAVVRAIPEFV